MTYTSINFADKFSLIKRQWEPKVIAEMNGTQFLLEKLKGDFVWHSHEDTDEVFIVITGNLRIDFRGGAVNIAPGEMFVVPKGVEHKPYAEHEVCVLILEPRDIAITGHEGKKNFSNVKAWI
ncbi:MAG: cupin domain-containing protein [Robiginitomaculum sp.]|nr:cupin domain-containing protein [Robiginitomaculum sp.]